MKKLTKKLAIVALSATLAVSAGAALGVVAYNQEPITASAAQTAAVDLKDAFEANSWGDAGDYKEALLYRLRSPSVTTYWSEFGASAGANDTIGETVLKNIFVNGKSIYDHNAEYKALIESGATSPITWTGMPNAKTGETRYMQPNIADDVAYKTTRFAPIFVNLCNHNADYGNSIDLYIPTAYLAKEDVKSIKIGKDFYLEKNGTSFGVSADVTFEVNAMGKPFKKMDLSNYEIKPTAVTKVDGSNNSATGWDSFLRFYLEESDYDNCNTTALPNKGIMMSLNFYNYVLFNGKPLLEYYQDDPINYEMFFNVWGKKNSYGVRWPHSLNSAVEAGKITEITILAGCQFPSATAFDSVIYEVKEEVTLKTSGNGIYERVRTPITSADITICEPIIAGDAGEFYQVNILCDKWLAIANGDIYDFNYNSTERQALRKNILINGVSLFDINANTDDSSYEYSTHPWNSTDPTHPAIFQHPTLVSGTAGRLSIFVHKDYIASLNPNTIEVTVKSGFIHYADNEYVVGEDVTAIVWKKPCTVSVITGNPRLDPTCVVTTEHKYGDTFKVSELVAPTAVGKTFAGWTDVEGNAITEDFTITESTAIYATWTVEVYTLTIVNGETKTEIKFGVENDGTLDATVAELAWILEDELPAEDNYNTYAWDVEVPETFELKDYTFTVVATEKVYTVTVITGNPRLDPNCAVTTEHKYGDTFKVSELVAPTAVGKTFAGWTDVEGNAITEDFTITESTAIYATWTVEVYTLTIVNGETTTEIKFGVENDGTLDATVAELAWILESELPAETETHTYAWDVEIPEAFELKDYTFTVVATEKEVESSDTTSGDSSDTTSGEAKPGKSGCGSAIGSTLAITGIALAASALIIKKRKED